MKNKSGYTTAEKDAQKKYWRDQYYRNKDSRIKRVREWQAKNKDKVREYQKRYVEKQKLKKQSI